MHYYMICHLFSFLQKHRVHTESLASRRSHLAFSFCFSSQSDQGRGWGCHFLFTHVDIKSENSPRRSCWLLVKVERSCLFCMEHFHFLIIPLQV